MTNKKELIEKLFNKGILVNQEMLDSKKIEDSILEKIEKESDLLVLNEDYTEIVSHQSSLVDWYDLDKYRVDVENERDDDLYQSQLQHFKQSSLVLKTPDKLETQEIVSLETKMDLAQSKASFVTEPEENETISDDLISLEKTPSSISSVTVVVSYQNEPHKYVIKDFVNFFSSRYHFLEGLLRNRRELESTLTINRLLGKKERDEVSIIGLVAEIGETKAGNIMLTLEDSTGEIKVLVSKNKKELYLSAKDLVVDEVIGVSGANGDKIVFANNIIWPDIPRNHELKKGEEDEHVIFLSDIHVGSKLFMKEEFKKFLKWLNGETGNEIQRNMANKVKYIFIAGDLVDGVGIYPSQEEELEITDITLQYAEFTELLKLVPQDKQIIICPGNHDVVHLAEPQPAFYQEFMPGLFDLPNVTLVTNPSLINIGKTKSFPGFDVLMYHGYSFDYYVANVESIRKGGGYHRSDLIMKFLLKRRHLAPSFTSTPYFPSHKEDPLLIKTVPDFLITGHIHYSSVANYKGVTMISGSCWQEKTSFQEKLGHEPEPARVPIVNLKTREVKVLRVG